MSYVFLFKLRYTNIGIAFSTELTKKTVNFNYEKHLLSLNYTLTNHFPTVSPALLKAVTITGVTALKSTGTSPQYH